MKKILSIALAIFICTYSLSQDPVFVSDDTFATKELANRKVGYQARCTYYTIRVIDVFKEVLSIEVSGKDTILIITDSAAAIKQLTAAIKYYGKCDHFKLYPRPADSLKEIEALVYWINYYAKPKNVHGYREYMEMYKKSLKDKDLYTTFTDLMINMTFSKGSGGNGIGNLYTTYTYGTGGSAGGSVGGKHY